MVLAHRQHVPSRSSRALMYIVACDIWDAGAGGGWRLNNCGCTPIAVSCLDAMTVPYLAI